MINNKEEIQFLQDCLPFYAHLNMDEQSQLIQSAYRYDLTLGEQLSERHENCSGLVVVMNGRLRAYILSLDGKEITLFRLLEKDICILSASGLFKNLQFVLYLDVEKDSTIYVVPTLVIEELSQYNMDVKEYLLEHMALRFSSAMWVMEQTVFGTLSQRIASFLLEQIILENSQTLPITHEIIAKNIGSSREVVSRMLKYFEKEHIVVTSRRKISIFDIEKLKMLAK
jgi:CRP/FNR family transcriptional regulator